MVTIVSFQLDNEFKKICWSSESLCDKQAYRAYPVSLRDDFISNQLYFSKLKIKTFLQFLIFFTFTKVVLGIFLCTDETEEKVIVSTY